jgi:hypothetical protein
MTRLCGSCPNVSTNSSGKKSGSSIGKATTYYFHLWIKINKCICIKYVSSQVINYQWVSFAFVIIIDAALQEQKEYNTLPYRILGTTQCYNKCPLTPFCNFLYKSTLVMLSWLLWQKWSSHVGNEQHAMKHISYIYAFWNTLNCVRHQIFMLFCIHQHIFLSFIDRFILMLTTTTYIQLW